jgi:hypothetical protein
MNVTEFTGNLQQITVQLKYSGAGAVRKPSRRGGPTRLKEVGEAATASETEDQANGPDP